MSDHNFLRPNQGYIYALSNPCFPYLKIGATKNGVLQRCQQLSRATAIPKPFKVVYKAFVNDYLNTEKQLHFHLQSQKVAKEFFDITVEGLTSVVETYFDTLDEDEILGRAIQKLSFD